MYKCALRGNEHLCQAEHLGRFYPVGFCHGCFDKGRSAPLALRLTPRDTGQGASSGFAEDTQKAALLWLLGLFWWIWCGFWLMGQ